MAFHVSCPITCRKICFCALGFSPSLHGAESKNGFLEEVRKLEEFLKDSWGVRAKGIAGGTVQVAVPKVVAVAPPPQPVAVVPDGLGGVDGVDEAAPAVSAQTKRAVLQRKAAAAMVAAEDYARRFESGDLAVRDDSIVPSGDEQQGQSNVKVMCRICFFGENEGSERAKKMLSCKSCGKKYHRSCLKNWAQHRDLFHWSSWACPSCRICEVCRRTGDPNKFMFCKRCDGAYHCYCQHPPHKNVSSGPYLCPRHTKCHSCESNVPGNGLSVRWFLSYTCCDACGRLFVKGNYCPVCLKVYRDSESTPMVCCDVCQRWVHCHCDGISDEKYLQFQVDRDLHYKCATCRGECYQVKDLEDAVREIWRRRDKADLDLIASLRAAAGLPTQEEIFSISPYSDDEENGPAMLKNEFGHTLKFSLKGLIEKSPKKPKDHGKKYSNKNNAKRKGFQTSLVSEAEPNQSSEGQKDERSFAYCLDDDKKADFQTHRNEVWGSHSSPDAKILEHAEGARARHQPGTLRHKLVDEVMVSDGEASTRVIRIKSNKALGADNGDNAGKDDYDLKTMKGKKIVINLGSRKINVTNSPKSDSSGCPKEQDSATSNGEKFNNPGQAKGLEVGEMDRNVIKLGKVRSEDSELTPKYASGNSSGARATSHMADTLVFTRKRSTEGTKAAVRSSAEAIKVKGDVGSSGEQFETKCDILREENDNDCQTPSLKSLPAEAKPLLKLKFKTHVLENQDSHHQGDKVSIKGQRSKRKRASPYVEKLSLNEDGASRSRESNLMDEIMDANWILKKLGKDAIGKRVEVHHPSENLWHKGVVTDVIDGTSRVCVSLDDGRVRNLELGKQGIRFVSQKQKRSRS